ncbi:hypothetical protein A1E_04400 [Rickettsia canadensis str. McKiel]|uniref:Uncharacterized protein n=1 Tax=Rickettsia canadensis (strain McKiel) TaxID=293613 RepID=A8EZM2_RICCK|nr:hypothetical protein A1E_04400 [Rickettsia canadensis str. McKiel]
MTIWKYNMPIAKLMSITERPQNLLNLVKARHYNYCMKHGATVPYLWKLEITNILSIRKT